MDERTSEHWSVTFTYDAAPDEATLQTVETALDESSTDVSVAALPREHRVTVTLYLPGPDPADAIESGRKLLSGINPEAVLGGPLIAVEAIAEAEQERRAAQPTLPELVGASEVGQMLGVSRQRVHQLREHDTFPAPLVEVAMGPLWDARAIEAFARAWSRRPGRPPLAVAQ
ncbi:MAG TPA: hypothetical protein VI357_15170 [Mycobacteriales bacterium]